VPAKHRTALLCPTLNTETVICGTTYT
jgi:hypothetical protein